MKKLAALVIIFAVVFSSQPVNAHILITDDSRTKGAVLHISPDDDPIAGQPSTIFFDIQNTALSENATTTLTISKDGEQNEVTAKLDGSLATFEYTFSAQGMYKLSFQVTSGEQAYTFTQPWRISRGHTTSALDTPRHIWAEIALLASGISFALLVIVMLGRWRHIWKQSTF